MSAGKVAQTPQQEFCQSQTQKPHLKIGQQRNYIGGYCYDCGSSAGLSEDFFFVNLTAAYDCKNLASVHQESSCAPARILLQLGSRPTGIL